MESFFNTSFHILVYPLLAPQQGGWYRVLGITAFLCPFLFFFSRKQLFAVYTRLGKGKKP